MKTSGIAALLATALLTLTACAQPAAPVAPKTVTVAPTEPAAPAPTAEPVQSVTMPDVSGMLLDEAYDQLAALGLNVLPDPVDGHAFAANYANWQVVGQDPAVGNTVTSAEQVTLDVVKTDEAEGTYCGDNDY